MKITLIAKDFGPATALRIVATKLLKSKIDVQTHFQEDLTEHTSLGDTDVLLSGMAFRPEEANCELRLIREAHKQGSHVALYADTWGCAERPWFQEVMPYVTTLFVVDETEACHLQSRYPSVHIHAVGNPLWQLAAFPKETRRVVRTRFNIREDAFVVLLICRKEQEINLPFLEICHVGLKGETATVLVSIHPSAPNRDEYRAIVETYGFRWVDGKTLEMLASTDVVVNTASGAGIEAIYMRKLVLEYNCDLVRDEVERLHYTRVWRPISDGAALSFVTGDDLRGYLKELRKDESMIREKLITSMETKYPTPQYPERAIDDMVRILTNL